MMIEIDARGENCPKPVIMTKKALESIGAGEGIVTIVDNEMAKENVSKLLKSMDIDFKVDQKEGDYYITAGSVEVEIAGAGAKKDSDENVSKNTVIMFDKDKMGHGNDELGAVLIKGFIYTLTELEELPSALLFVNSGIKLTTTGSAVIEDIKQLEARGVEILSCGTCLDYYGLQDGLEVGGVTNMYTIVEKLMEASNTIKL
ncbi:SirA-like protein [Andreesenia angusta]|uniref:SirA-like protein n=1 Tax=Andreesenia angusta TaxID=39480 RepID=A0A1S1V502_9FIRM|nr:sulfurtransferase-like selenium metabolism protein YedF [Andreesenia angusta]OHW61618.1 SirA-like protein [Andreesenia angusta]